MNGSVGMPLFGAGAFAGGGVGQIAYTAHTASTASTTARSSIDGSTPACCGAAIVITGTTAIAISDRISGSPGPPVSIEWNVANTHSATAPNRITGASYSDTDSTTMNRPDRNSDATM